MSNKVVINRGDSDVRVAFLENDHLVEFHKESLNDKSIVGNIYRGVIQDVIPGLQAAFVDVGLERNVFVHFLDIRPESLVMTEKNLEKALIEASKKVLPGRIVKKGRRDRIDTRAGNVEAPIKKGDTIIVQVTKDGISDKAPRVSANLAIAGRYVVMLPFPGQDGGVSRKIAGMKDRIGLKKILKSLKKETHSFIMRTAGLGADEEHIRHDVERLEQIWDDICKEFQRHKKTGLVYSDHNIVDRLVRDAFTSEIDSIHTDDANLARELKTSLHNYMPELEKSIETYEGMMPIFESFGIDKQLEKALDKKVWLKSGGYLIVEETEALTAIDVNTGRFTGNKDQERTSFQTNMEACRAIAEQIRLRDIGGIIAVDFIDMLNRSNQNKVTNEFMKQMENDRAKSQIGSIGDFGILMLTRKRKYKSLLKQMYEPCPYCEGNARVLRKEEVWRNIKGDILLLCDDASHYSAVIITCESSTAEYLQKESARFVQQLAEALDLEIIIRVDLRLHVEDFTLTGVERPGRDSLLLPDARLSDKEVFQDSISYDELSTQELVNSIDRHIEEVESTDSKDEEDTDSEKKKTRRGRRGGRKKRGNEEAEVVDISQNLSDEETTKKVSSNNNGTAKKSEVPVQSSNPSAFKSRLQIVKANTLSTENKKQDKKANPFEGMTTREGASDVSQLKRVMILDPSKKKTEGAPETAKTEAPKAEAKSSETSAHKPSTAIQVVAQWGTKKAEEKSDSKAGEQKDTKRSRRRRPRRTEEPKETRASEASESKDQAENQSTATSTKKAAKKSSSKKAAKKSAAKKSAKKSAAKKKASASSDSVAESSSTSGSKKAAKKASKKAAKKSTKKASKKAAKKSSAKKSAKKATKKSAKKTATKSASKKGDNES